ncbi:hypothetical protein DFJ63DRAFT_318344 [Scheffersomyces coipomensis]|uniref:uncharacterized protein n=1 Tax=Scheffersomyces coipomensis TaxID=1788519 RepID=UPI00315C83C6
MSSSPTTTTGIPIYQDSYQTNNDGTSSPPQQHPPIDSPPFSNNAKFKRNYRACLNCRVRKVKCDLGPVDNPRQGKCARCLRERKDCVFVESKRGGVGNVANGKKRRKVGGSGSDTDGSNPDTPHNTASISTSPSLVRSQNNSTNHLNNHNNNNVEYQDITVKKDVVHTHHHHQSKQSQPITRLPTVDDMLNKAARHPQTPPISDIRQTQKIQQQEETQTTPRTAADESNSHFSTMEGALTFLANAAGTIAKADERDNIDARVQHAQIEASQHRTDSRMNSSESLNKVSNIKATDSANGSNVINSSSGNDSVSDFSTSQLQTNGEGLSSSSSAGISTAGKHSESTIPQYIKPNLNKRMTMPAAESASMVRPRGSNKLSNIEYIGGENGILTEDEAERLIHLFFTTMHPFFPHLPKFLHSSKVLSGYPILLCAILTIASRYHPFENNTGMSGTAGGVPRNIEVHDRLWLYVQRLISQTVWAEASTRSIGTVFAFLLFTEWNPRAIHWRWSDYANKADDGNDNDLISSSGGNYVFPDVPNIKGPTGSSSSGAGSTSDVSNLAGLGAMRRSYRMAWMLIGSAVRLAQDMGFMEMSSKTFLATHISEINSVMNISRRSMLGHSLSEVELDEDEISEEALEKEEDLDDQMLNMNEEDQKKLPLDAALKFTLSQKAQVELLQIISLGHESLYGYRAQLGSLTQRQNLSVLNLISPLINNWGRKYKQYLIPSNPKILRNVSNVQTHWLNPQSKISKDIAECIERESFIFEYNYVKLYIYSLALSPSPRSLSEQRKSRKGKVTLKLDEISKSAKYIEMAFKSANEMLHSAHRVHRLKMLRFMPVRWLTRMVRAVAFIVKCYLTITAHKNSAKNTTSSDNFDATILSLSLISVDDIIQSIQKAAITLRDCSPDELHLCTRYSTVLMYLCSEMKTKAKSFPEVNIDYDPNAGSTKKKTAHFNEQAQENDEEEEDDDDFELNETSPSQSPADLLIQSQQPKPQQPFAPQPVAQSQIQVQVQQAHPQPQVVMTQSVPSSSGGDIYQQPQVTDFNQFVQPRPVRTQSIPDIPNQQQQQQQQSINYNPYFATRNNSYSNASNSESMTPSNTGDVTPAVATGEWFMNDKNIGLDFVVPWMEMIEQQLNTNDFNFDYNGSSSS